MKTNTSTTFVTGVVRFIGDVKALGLNAGIPADGRTVTVVLTPKDVGTFEIDCSN